jgi:hypothetical protein
VAGDESHKLVGFRLASTAEPRELAYAALDDARDAAIGEPLVACYLWVVQGYL